MDPPVVVGCDCALTVVGNIVTDGVFGVLNESDIVGWNLLISGAGVTHLLTSATTSSMVSLSGSELSATSADLLFNFSGMFGYFQIAENINFGVCYSANVACVTLPHNGAGFTRIYFGTAGGSYVTSGTQTIATVAPEASTLAFAGLGLALLAFNKMLLLRR